jgi:hypothetical protein
MEVRESPEEAERNGVRWTWVAQEERAMPEGSESRRAQPGVPSTAGGAESAVEVLYRQRTSSLMTSPRWGTADTVDAESGADLASAHALRPCPRPKSDFGVRLRSDQTKKESAESARGWWVS